MNFKRPVLSSVILIGLFFSAVFVSFFLLSFIDSRLLVATAETVAVVIGSMALFFGAIYFMMKKRYQPHSEMEDGMFNHSGSIAKLPTKGTEAVVIAMTRTN